MQPAIKIVVAILVVALIAVIGLIVMSQGNGDGAGEPAAAATTAPAEPSAQTTEVPTASPEADPASAQEESAQDDTLYEGALAGLSEEEIAKLALAEEESSERHDEDGAEGAVD